MNGLKRYNEIQKALSSIKREKGWQFHGSRFQELASQIYKETKKQPLKQVVNNFDVIIEAIPGKDTPLLPSELTDWNYYFLFDKDNITHDGVVETAVFPKDLLVKSPQLWGDDIPIDSTLLNYEDHFKDFSDYMNINRKYCPDKYGAEFRFTDPEYDWNEGKFVTILEIKNLYGYESGIGAIDNEQGVLEEIEVGEEVEEIPVVEEEPVKEKPKKEDWELQKVKLEIEKTKVEAEKIKASKEKLSELNKAVKNLDSQLKRGIITKKEYKKYLNKLYEM